MPNRHAVSAVLFLVTLVAARPAYAQATVTPRLAGFSAVNVGSFESGPCQEEGPTAMVVANRVLYLAADGLYVRHPGSALGEEGNGLSPWGLAALGDKLFATQPACGQPESDPVTGNRCTLVEFSPVNGAPVRTVSPQVCGFAVTDDPVRRTLTVALRSGAVVDIDPGTGAQHNQFSGPSADPVVNLDWSRDGSRLYLVRRSGALSVIERGTTRSLLTSGASGVVARTEELGLEGFVLAAVGTQVRILSTDGRPPPSQALASSNTPTKRTAPGPDGAYVGLSREVWLLQGRYNPPPPPPPPASPTTTPPTTAPPERARVPAAQTTVALPPPPPAQPPPPPPPPAPPIPPLATATQLVAQPSVAANPAFVPAEEEREAALRLAAVGREPVLAPWLVWLALAFVAGAGGGALGRASTARRSQYAWSPSPPSPSPSPSPHAWSPSPPHAWSPSLRRRRHP